MVVVVVAVRGTRNATSNSFTGSKNRGALSTFLWLSRWEGEPRDDSLTRWVQAGSTWDSQPNSFCSPTEHTWEKTDCYSVSIPTSCLIEL